MTEQAESTDRLPYHRSTVRQEWIDYNGHMSEAFYVLVFGHATDALMLATGMGPRYREHSGCSLYTAEAHVRYLREVPEGAELTVRTRILGADAKKARFTHEMYVDEPDPDARPDASPVATAELLGIHVDQNAGGAAPLPDEVREHLVGLTEEPPAWAGRSIGPVPKPQA